MKNADFTTGAAKMMSALKMLRSRWEETKEVWQDANSRRFEETYLDPLEPQMKLALEAIGTLAELMARAERDCE